jgi:hypothetical protein
MIWHDYITGYTDVVVVKVVKPFVNGIIGLRLFEQLKPFITGESNEVKAVRALIVLKANRHELKILLNKSRGLCIRTRLCLILK